MSKNIKCINFPGQAHTSSLYSTREWSSSQFTSSFKRCILLVPQHARFLPVSNPYIYCDRAMRKWLALGDRLSTRSCLYYMILLWRERERLKGKKKKEKSCTDRFLQFCSHPIIPCNNGCLSLVSGIVNENECPSVLLFCT